MQIVELWKYDPAISKKYQQYQNQGRFIQIPVLTEVLKNTCNRISGLPNHMPGQPRQLFHQQS